MKTLKPHLYLSNLLEISNITRSQCIMYSQSLFRWDCKKLKSAVVAIFVFLRHSHVCQDTRLCLSDFFLLTCSVYVEWEMLLHWPEIVEHTWRRKLKQIEEWSAQTTLCYPSLLLMFICLLECRKWHCRQSLSISKSFYSETWTQKILVSEKTAIVV